MRLSHELTSWPAASFKYQPPPVIQPAALETGPDLQQANEAEKRMKLEQHCYGTRVDLSGQQINPKKSTRIVALVMATPHLLLLTK